MLIKMLLLVSMEYIFLVYLCIICITIFFFRFMALITSPVIKNRRSSIFILSCHSSRMSPRPWSVPFIFLNLSWSRLDSINPDINIICILYVFLILVTIFIIDVVIINCIDFRSWLERLIPLESSYLVLYNISINVLFIFCLSDLFLYSFSKLIDLTDSRNIRFLRHQFLRKWGSNLANIIVDI